MSRAVETWSICWGRAPGWLTQNPQILWAVFPYAWDWMVQDFAGLSEGCQRMGSEKFCGWPRAGRRLGVLTQDAEEERRNHICYRRDQRLLGQKMRWFSQMVPGFFPAQPPGN